MDTLLHHLYSGKLNPEEFIRPRSAQYSMSNKKISDTIEICRKIFSENEYQLLNEVVDLMHTSGTMQESEAFIYGFKMGALMMMEVLEGREEFVRE